MYDPITMKLNADPYILSALQEDITSEDVSTNAVIRKPCLGEVDLICKEEGIICGLDVFARVFELIDQEVEVTIFVKDGDLVKVGEKMAKVRGDVRALLTGERTALNYLQRMSGIATYTHSVAALLKGTGIQLLDTRKTSPNNRIFEKYAVRIGGGHNHRYNLTDGVLLKETIDMVKDAVEAGADIIMLDNMTPEVMEEAIALIDHRAEIEISGNVTKENIEKIKDLGVNYISSGALTHSAPILDISLKNLHPVS